MVTTLGVWGENHFEWNIQTHFLNALNLPTVQLNISVLVKVLWVGFCLGRCCGPLYEKISQMWLRYMHSPSWKEKRIHHLQLMPQMGDISASRQCSNIKPEEVYRNVPINFRGRGRGDTFFSFTVWSHSALTFPLRHRSLPFAFL